LFHLSPLFTPREKAAIHFADMLSGDHEQISQDLFDELRRHFSEPEILALGWRIAMFVGWGRLSAALRLDDVGGLPAHSRSWRTANSIADRNARDGVAAFPGWLAIGSVFSPPAAVEPGARQLLEPGLIAEWRKLAQPSELGSAFSSVPRFRPTVSHATPE
jgi:hypothetical protein